MDYSRAVLIEPRSAGDPVIAALSREQEAELAAAHVAHPQREGIEFVAGIVDGRPVACGALQPLGDGIGEITRMYVRPAYRRQGLSHLILAALEELAVARWYHTLRRGRLAVLSFSRPVPCPPRRPVPRAWRCAACVP